MAHNIVRAIVQAAIAGSQVVGRAFVSAVRKEYNASAQAAQRAGGGKKGTQSAASSSLFGMSIDEAKQILNVDNIRNAEEVLKSYEHLMKVNEKASGGSFYLQSKVYRAKERIDSEVELDKTKTEKTDSS